MNVPAVTRGKTKRENTTQNRSHLSVMLALLIFFLVLSFLGLCNLAIPLYVEEEVSYEDVKPPPKTEVNEIQIEWERIVDSCYEPLDRSVYKHLKIHPTQKQYPNTTTFIVNTFPLCDFNQEQFGGFLLGFVEYINLYKLLLNGDDGSATAKLGKPIPHLAERFKLVEPLYFHQTRNNKYWEAQFASGITPGRVCEKNDSLLLRGASEQEFWDKRIDSKDSLQNCYLGASFTRFGEVHDIAKLEKYLGVEVIRWDDFVSLKLRNIQLICGSTVDYCNNYTTIELNGIKWEVASARKIDISAGEGFRKGLIKEILDSHPGVIGIPYLRNSYIPNAYFYLRNTREIDFEHIMPLLLPNTERIAKAKEAINRLRSPFLAFHWRRGDRMAVDAKVVTTQTPQFVASMLNTATDKYSLSSILLMTNSDNEEEIFSIRNLTRVPVFIYHEGNRGWIGEGKTLVEEMIIAFNAEYFIGSGEHQYDSNVSTIICDWIVINKFNGSASAANKYILNPNLGQMSLLYFNGNIRYSEEELEQVYVDMTA